jgi:transcriptional regulator with XRE-family HTH domain
MSSLTPQQFHSMIKERDLRYKEVARACGVTPHHIGRIATGKRRLTAEIRHLFSCFIEQVDAERARDEQRLGWQLQRVA